MDIKFIFWNIQDKDEKTIGPVIDELLPADIICVAETKVADSFFLTKGYSLIQAAEKKGKRGIIHKTMKLYFKKGLFKINHVGNYGNGEMISALLEVGVEKILIFSTHFASNLTVTHPEKKLGRATNFRNYIESIESINQTNKSIVFGDFNSNPFEPVFTSTAGFFAIDLLKPPPRRLKNYPYFINPTVSQIGHFNYFNNNRRKPPGSFYYNNKDFNVSSELFWNTFDGLLFRPNLLNNFSNGSELEIIAGTKSHMLYDPVNMKINEIYSDHLPITFTFKF